MRLHQIVAVLSGILLLCCSAPARAISLDAPTGVQADPNGAFSYNAKFTAQAPVIIAGFEIAGLPANNVDNGVFIADCFCPPFATGCPVNPGVPFVIPVSGSLLDPSKDGSVSVAVFLCGGGSFVVNTTILHHTIVPTTVPTTVPTLSVWGMASLVLVLLAGLTIKFGAMKPSRKAA